MNKGLWLKFTDKVGGFLTGTKKDDKIAANIYAVGGLGTPLAGKDWDHLSVNYNSNAPTNTADEYTFKTGGSGGTTVATITVTYATTAKEDISTVEVS